MARYPRQTLSGHDTSYDTIALLPDNPDHGQLAYVNEIKQAVAYDAIDEAWYALGPIQNEGAPTDGTSGTGVGVLFVGALCINITAGSLWQNAGSAASPSWVLVGTETTG